MTRTVTGADTGSIVYVNCVTHKPVSATTLLAQRVEEELRANLKHVVIGDIFHSPTFYQNHDVLAIEIADHSGSHDAAEFSLDDSSLIHVDVFSFHAGDSYLSDHVQHLSQRNGIVHHSHRENDPADDDAPLPIAKVMELPHQDLEHHWRTLIFEGQLQFKILKYLLRRISFAARRASAGVWSHILLFHGPPGSGKTSLCLALAQQLSIRLRGQYPHFKLVKIDAQSIFSKWFSESGKAVSRLFSAIEEMLDQDAQTFICVLVDEVESLASTRQECSGASEPKDVMRAVNALLVAVDRLRQRPNIVVMCTSNLLGAIDDAFLDRVDDKYYIGNPCLAACYEMLRQEYSELSRSGIVVSSEDKGNGSNGMISKDIPENDPIDVLFKEACQWWLAFGRSHLAMDRLHHRASLAIRLYKLAADSLGLSGRVLRNIPERSLSQLTTMDPCPLHTALEAAESYLKELKSNEHAT